MNALELSNLLKTAINHKLRVLIVGAPGTGKTAIVTQVCREVGVDLFYLHPAVSDPTDFKGLPAMREGEAEFMPYGDMRKLAKVTKRTVVLCDDIGQAGFSVQAALMQPLHGGRINGHVLSNELVWIGATNDTTDMAGVQGVIEPVKSRFNTIVKLEPTIDEWRMWAMKAQLPPELIAYLSKCPDKLCQFKPSREMTNSPCPRNWESIGRWLNAGITDQEVFAGAVGKGDAAQFCLFRQSLDQLPNLDECIAKPNDAPVPDAGHFKYAVVSGLASKTTKKNYGNCLQYVKRLTKPFEVLYVKVSKAMHPDVIETAAFNSWAMNRENQNACI